VDTDSHSDEKIIDVLSLKNVAVIGMSKHPSKAAHYVPKYLIDNGYGVTPVNPTADKILNMCCYESVAEIDGPVDIIDVFRPSDQISSLFMIVLRKNPK